MNIEINYAEVVDRLKMQNADKDVQIVLKDLQLEKITRAYEQLMNQMQEQNEAQVAVPVEPELIGGPTDE